MTATVARSVEDDDVVLIGVDAEDGFEPLNVGRPPEKLGLLPGVGSVGSSVPVTVAPVGLVGNVGRLSVKL